MKKLILLLCGIILFSGCGKKEETVVATCKRDEIQPTYTASFTFVLKTIDNESISSLDISSLYNLTYTDVDPTNINNKIKEEVEIYKKDFKDVTAEIGDNENQPFYNLSIPMNEENVQFFQNADPTYVKDGKLLINNYRNFLSTSGYICS